MGGVEASGAWLAGPLSFAGPRLFYSPQRLCVGGGDVGCVWEVTRIEMSDRFRVVGVTGRVFELLTQLT